MFFLTNNKKECCGCTACYNICPRNAISMYSDKEGFLYPVINKKLCIDCGLCKKVCAFKEKYKIQSKLDKPIVYGAKLKDFNERITSRSGGIFVAISDFILNNDGHVYGVGFDENLKVCHKCAKNKKELKEFKGSKYVQSDLNDIFKKVLEDLENDKYVLFTGTPCQTSGLDSFLKMKKISKEKLILVDIVCHGVPSPLIYRQYLNYIEKKMKIKIEAIDFRDKSFGWNTHLETIYYGKGKKLTLDYYTSLFYQGVILRPACENCKFTNLERPSDITLADFWNIDKCIPNFNDNNGVSLILVNTRKGEIIWKNINSYLDFEKYEGNKFIQRNLVKPTQFSDKRNQFWKDYSEKNFSFIAKKYMGDNFKNKLKKQIKKIILK